MIIMSDENGNEDIRVGAGGADVGSNPTPRTNTPSPESNTFLHSQQLLIESDAEEKA